MLLRIWLDLTFSPLKHRGGATHLSAFFSWKEYPHALPTPSHEQARRRSSGNYRLVMLTLICQESDGITCPGRYLQAQEGGQEEAAHVYQKDVMLDQARQASVMK